MKAMEGLCAFGLDVVDMCLVPGVEIHDFEKYKGISNYFS